MPTLTINDFSCIKEAVFTLSPINVIIGPQGSGKSVTTKMFYFCSDILNTFSTHCEKGDQIDQYKKILAKLFAVWFPPSAWGRGRFNISYVAGPFSIRILRRKSKGVPVDEVSVTFSEWFSSKYHSTLELFANDATQQELALDAGTPVRDTLDRLYQTRDLVSRGIASEMGKEMLSHQTFIPAGRAFFTSIGRLVAGLEHAGSLDPVTIKFARLFATLRDRGPSRMARTLALSDETRVRRDDFMKKLFGGEIKYDNDTEYVETSDGRKIPFSSLSSGQQELLPMWSLMDYFHEMDAFRSRTNRPAPRFVRGNELLYIEEPEAHLFPSAQSLLMEFLIGAVIGNKGHRSLIITTHSPYIMGKLNVFLKAGQLSRRKKRNSDINEIVQRDCWLSPASLSAFAIEDQKLRPLIDEDGLIDGSYLDQVSESISAEFSNLLQIEHEMASDRSL